MQQRGLICAMSRASLSVESSKTGRLNYLPGESLQRQSAKSQIQS